MFSSQLEFKYERISDQNLKEWKAYFNKEWSTMKGLETLMTPLNESDGDPRYFLKAVKDRDQFRTIFIQQFGKAALLPENFETFKQRIWPFLQKMLTPRDKPLLYSFYDPMQNACVTIKSNINYPEGLYMASIFWGTQTVMSVMVVPSPNKEAQCHKFIFKSLNYMIHQALHNTPRFPDLSPKLHAFAAISCDAKVIVTRPVHKMVMILEDAGFTQFRNEEKAEAQLGTATYSYINAYGIGDKDYPMVYRINDNVFKSTYDPSLAPPKESFFSNLTLFADSNKIDNQAQTIPSMDCNIM